LIQLQKVSVVLSGGGRHGVLPADTTAAATEDCKRQKERKEDNVEQDKV